MYFLLELWSYFLLDQYTSTVWHQSCISCPNATSIPIQLPLDLLHCSLRRAQLLVYCPMFVLVVYEPQHSTLCCSFLHALVLTDQ